MCSRTALAESSGDERYVFRKLNARGHARGHKALPVNICIRQSKAGVIKYRGGTEIVACGCSQVIDVVQRIAEASDPTLTQLRAKRKGNDKTNYIIIGLIKPAIVRAQSTGKR